MQNLYFRWIYFFQLTSNLFSKVKAPYIRILCNWAFNLNDAAIPQLLFNLFHSST